MGECVCVGWQQRAFFGKRIGRGEGKTKDPGEGRGQPRAGEGATRRERANEREARRGGGGGEGEGERAPSLGGRLASDLGPGVLGQAGIELWLGEREGRWEGKG